MTFMTELLTILTFLTGNEFDYLLGKVFSYSCLRPTGHFDQTVRGRSWGVFIN